MDYNEILARKNSVKIGKPSFTSVDLYRLINRVVIGQAEEDEILDVLVRFFPDAVSITGKSE